MTVYEFTLVLDSDVELDAALEDRLFEAGMDDALLGARDGIVFVDLSREGGSFLEVAVSAIRQVEEALGRSAVSRVEPDELVTAADIGVRVGRTRESIRLLVAGQRGPGGFPVPVRGIASRQRLWRWSEVAQWMWDALPGSVSATQVEVARALSTLNSALNLRRHPDSAAKELLVRLAG